MRGYPLLRDVPVRLPRDGVLLREPEDVRHVLVRNEGNYVKSRRLAGARARYPVRATSLLASSGDDHRRRRRAMQPAFRHGIAGRLADAARANAGRLVAGWRDGLEIDAAEAMTALAQRNILETLFAASDPDLDDLAEIAAARRRLFERVFLSRFPAPEYLPTRATRHYLRATRRLDAAIAAELDARRTTNGRAPDVLSLLMESPLDDRQLRDEVRTLSLTGYDSVRDGLAWTLYLLALHPEADAELAAEARSAARDLPYTTAVVRESLRLYPPTWIFVRIARGDDALPSGQNVAEAQKVHVCPYVVHRDPRHWPEPERFNPARFLEGAGDGRPRYAYFPFGGGPHVCIGETIAIAQMVAVLATIAARFRLTLAPGAEVVPEPGLTLRPRGLRMVVAARG